MYVFAQRIANGYKGKVKQEIESTPERVYVEDFREAVSVASRIRQNYAGHALISLGEITLETSGEVVAVL